jgi:hypothetical protein
VVAVGDPLLGALGVVRKGYRKCRKCGVSKGPSAYTSKGHTHGPRGKPAKRAYICTACFKNGQKERERQLQRWHRYGRDCPECGERRTCPGEIGVSHNAICLPCQRRKRAENARRRYAEDPEPNREAGRKWRRENPGKAAASSRKWRAKYMERLAQDPQLRRRHLELRRIDDKLYRELAGGAWRAVAPMGNSNEGPWLAVAPLIARLEALRRRLGIEVNPAQSDPVYISFCESLGVSDRTMREWRTGERKQAAFGTVDRVLTNTGLLWFDIYEKPANGHKSGRPEDVLRYIDEAQVYIAACLAFEGELVE